VSTADAGRTALGSRPSPSVFGMVLFLASELMFFGGLFASYFTLRGQTRLWPPPDVDLDLPLTLVATGMLTASSLTMHLGLLRLRSGRVAAMRNWVVVTFALGGGFLAIKAYEFAAAGFGIGSHAYGSLWFTMLGAHGLHLAVGLALLMVLLGRAARYAREPGGGEAIGYYWHFVDAVWLAIFGTIYLIR
jgi:cytochrome c oxidase subunit III